MFGEESESFREKKIQGQGSPYCLVGRERHPSHLHPGVLSLLLALAAVRTAGGWPGARAALPWGGRSCPSAGLPPSSGLPTHPSRSTSAPAGRGMCGAGTRRPRARSGLRGAAGER